jgi:signal transduction histidine kinase
VRCGILGIVMRLRFRLAGLRRRPHPSWRTFQVRLALSYWGLFVASGAVLLAVTVALWQGVAVTHVHPAGAGRGAPAAGHPAGHGVLLGSDLGPLLAVAGIALALMAVVSIACGWLVAGRLLGPVRAITAAARRISATSLHERINLAGPDDDLKELADTFDGLLARLERSFVFERRFVANASHELRTPLTTMRVWLDVAQAKPGPQPPQLVSLAGRLRRELDHVDALLESFLTLARTQQGPAADQSTVSLAGIATGALESRAGAIADLRLSVDRGKCPDVWVRGSATLLARMVENVIDNAIRHNEAGGWIRVSTESGGSVARIVVENGGALLSHDDVSHLGQPFQRPGAERTGSDRGTGLGLSIVDSIATVHGGRLGLSARAGGGLRVVITLPLAVTAAAGASA